MTYANPMMDTTIVVNFEGYKNNTIEETLEWEKKQ
jgi:hypothetical protein